jgi:hypothetical protein
MANDLINHWGYLSPLEYAEKHYKSSLNKPILYPQTASGNHLKIEESRLVDKEVKRMKTPI